ncbi:hypothetical protein Gotur_022868 [Gossypium turneri]
MKVSSFLFFLFLYLSLFLSDTSHGGSDDDDDTGSNKRHNLRSKSLVLVKIWCLILVFVGTFISGVSPYFLKWNQGFLVLGTQFAGGVFLGTAIMHFLSDANETFEDLTTKQYPFAFMLTCVGYLVTMVADSVVSYVYGKGKGSSCHTYDLELHGKKVVYIYILHYSTFLPHFLPKLQGQAPGQTLPVNAIAMGIALLRMIPDRPFLSCIAYAFAFAISSPAGVAIGIILDATTEGVMADWIFAISMGLACGVFIYVSINHLLSKGYTPHKTVSVDKPHYKFLAVLLGVGVIAVVMIWDN